MANVLSNKKQRRLCKFNNKWLEDYKYKDWIKKVDGHNVRCLLCNTHSFSIGYKGEADLEIHMSSTKHIQAAKSRITNELIDTFMIMKDSIEDDKIAAAELAMVYHTVNHHHSYLSLDYNSSLNRIIFNDSKTVTKISFGRTKASAIASNVLCSHSIEQHIHYLVKNKVKFSISNDASNKGNRKMFPIVIQYFHMEDGMKRFVLDFYETGSETNYSIYTEIKRKISKYQLKVDDIIAFGAENASINYGNNKSVFVNLKLENENIIKANCLCHVIHNCAKKAFLRFPFDIQNFVLKIYDHFAVSAKRNDLFY